MFSIQQLYEHLEKVMEGFRPLSGIMFSIPTREKYDTLVERFRPLSGIMFSI